jgi:hypothetical protein
MSVCLSPIPSIRSFCSVSPNRQQPAQARRRAAHIDAANVAHLLRPPASAVGATRSFNPWWTCTVPGTLTIVKPLDHPSVIHHAIRLGR